MDNEFDQLKKAIRAERKRQKKTAIERREDAEEKSWMALGFRIGTELLAGLIVGGIIGYFIDYFFGTSPWALILLLFLGGVAGTLNVCMMLLKQK